MTRLLWHPKTHYSVHSSLPLESVISEINSVCTLRYLFWYYLTIDIFTLRWFFFSGFPVTMLDALHIFRMRYGSANHTAAAFEIIFHFFSNSFTAVGPSQPLMQWLTWNVPREEQTTRSSNWSFISLNILWDFTLAPFGLQLHDANTDIIWPYANVHRVLYRKLNSRALEKVENVKLSL